jgi:hypothetical protein
MVRKPGGNHRMIIKSSDQVPRTTLLKRFPIPRNFGVTHRTREDLADAGRRDAR